jgi:hypothetical protein
VLDVNQHTLEMFGVTSKDKLLGQLSQLFRDEMMASFAEQRVDLWQGKLSQTSEVVNYSLKGGVDQHSHAVCGDARP